jgi:hypothetical protein
LYTYKEQKPGTYICTVDLEQLFLDNQDHTLFNQRWKVFLNSDPYNQKVFTRDKDMITYPHKSWIPKKRDNRIPLLILSGNPAPHSTYRDVYYAHEGKGTEHRFWKVLRELGYVDLIGTDPQIKAKFFELEYNSPFRLGFEVIFTFPSAASIPKWSGVAGLEKLFGRKAFKILYEQENLLLQQVIREFFQGQKWVIVCMQKDAFNAVSSQPYSLGQAVLGNLNELLKNNIKIWGTPPTRWLYTQKMKMLLNLIKEDTLNL